MDQKEALSNCLNEEVYFINQGQGKIFMNPKKNPLFQHLPQFLSTVFKRLRICVNAIAFRNFTVVTAVIGQDFVFRMAERRLNVL